MNLVTEKIKFATVKYETAKKTEPVTAVWRYGWFRFSVAGKSKAGNLHIFTTNPFHVAATDDKRRNVGGNFYAESRI